MKALKLRGHSSHTRPPCGTRLIWYLKQSCPYKILRSDKSFFFKVGCMMRLIITLLPSTLAELCHFLLPSYSCLLCVQNQRLTNLFVMATLLKKNSWWNQLLERHWQTIMPFSYLHFKHPNILPTSDELLRSKDGSWNWGVSAHKILGKNEKILAHLLYWYTILVTKIAKSWLFGNPLSCEGQLKGLTRHT